MVMTACRRCAPSSAPQIRCGTEVTDCLRLGLTPGDPGEHQVSGRRFKIRTNRLDDDRAGHAAQGRINAFNGK